MPTGGGDTEEGVVNGGRWRVGWTVELKLNRNKLASNGGGGGGGGCDPPPP